MMGIVRYIDETIGEVGEGLLTSLPEAGGASCRVRLRIEELGADKKTRVSTLRLAFEIKTAAVWTNRDRASVNGLDVYVDGTKAEFTMLPKTGGSASEWFTIAESTVQTAPRAKGTDSCELRVATDYTSFSSTYASWTHGNTRRNAARVGTYSMPLAAIRTGSTVKIGGESYGVYIGNGESLVRYNAMIGGERY